MSPCNTHAPITPSELEDEFQAGLRVGRKQGARKAPTLGCPAWCTVEPQDHDGGFTYPIKAYTIDHDGPTFGEHVSTHALTFANTDTLAEPPHVLLNDGLRTFQDPDELDRLAAHLTAAAEWLRKAQTEPATA